MLNIFRSSSNNSR